MKERAIVMTKNHPALIRQGLKTETRRVITKGNSVIGEGGNWDKLDFEGKTHHKDKIVRHFNGEEMVGLVVSIRQVPLPFVDGESKSFGQYLHVPYDWADDERIFRVYPRYEVGDLLWVKETWWEQSGDIYYKADWNNDKPVNMECDGGKWRSPRFLPKWAARTWLEIVEVRAERLQEITEEGAIAEGIIPKPDLALGVPPFLTVKGQYAMLGYPWASNPWCWVIKFKMVERRDDTKSEKESNPP